MYYLIRETLEECGAEAIASGEQPYVAVLTPDEWKECKDIFAFGIDMETDPPAKALTRAIVNYDSLTGSINVPKMGYTDHESGHFSFVLDEKGIVFIDKDELAGHLVGAIAEQKRWRMPGLERFIYDFLEEIISPDLARLEVLEHQMERMEEKILEGDAEMEMSELNDARGSLLDMDLHYRQLIDFGQELEENENDFFKEENLRYFHMFTVRVERLIDMVDNLKDYSVQLRDLIQTRIDVKQNRIMSLLTVITTVFTPLTLITGWYGMNFKYMPELEYKWSYPVVILISLGIAIGCLVYFRKKKWL